MAYANEQMAADRPVATLQSISISAERVAKATAALNSFLDRFHGNNPPATIGETARAIPAPSGYRSDLDRLTDEVSGLELAASRINELG